MGRDASVLRDGFIFPEGLRWRSGRLWVSDQLAGTVHTVTEDGKAELVLEVPGGASGLGWLPDGSLLVVSMADRRLLRLGPDGATTEHANLAHLVRDWPQSNGDPMALLAGEFPAVAGHPGTLQKWWTVNLARC